MGTGFLQEDNGNSSSVRLGFLLTVCTANFIAAFTVVRVLGFFGEVVKLGAVEVPALDSNSIALATTIIGFVASMLSIAFAGKAYQKGKEQTVEPKEEPKPEEIKP